ncbi:MAG: ATP-binding protein [Nocardioides sp.]
MRARVIVLAGPSGAGKSRLAERLGLPVLRLDDFYKSGDDPTLPTIASGATSTRLVSRLLRTGNAGLTDWDHPDSWLLEDALVTLAQLCREGSAEVPMYEIARNGRCGSQVLDLDGSAFFVAEGIFAPEVVEGCADRGLLAAAYCVRQHRMVTFWRRLTRDLRERRKPPMMLLRRGWALLRDQDRVVAHAVARGCRPVTPDEAHADIQLLTVLPPGRRSPA